MIDCGGSDEFGKGFAEDYRSTDGAARAAGTDKYPYSNCIGGLADENCRCSNGDGERSLQDLDCCARYPDVRVRTGLRRYGRRGEWREFSLDIWHQTVRCA